MIERDSQRNHMYQMAEEPEPTFVQSPGRTSGRVELVGTNAPAVHGARGEVAPARLDLFPGIPITSAAPSTPRPITGGALPRLDLGAAGQPSKVGSARRTAAPKRVADAKPASRDGANAVLKVIVYFDDGEARIWSGKASWGEGLATSYSAQREGYTPNGRWI
jgi:hypothetical protein